MPNFPTSLLLSLLALCWLFVLVPMFARSREPVPETDDGVGGFRVVRSAGKRQSRKELREREAKSTGGVMTRSQNPEPDDLLVEDLVDEEIDWDAFDDDDDSADDELDGHRLSEPVRPPVVARTAPIRSAVTEYDDHLDARAHRPGRGGFDPEHARITADYRFRRRRAVSLTLLVLALASAAGAVLVAPMLWTGTIAFALVLVVFLSYLSRQVKVEREIQARRMARLQRAREIRPPARRSAAVSPYGRTEGRLVEDAPTTAFTHVPAAPRGPGVVVDLDDDDPVFDDLEYYEPVVYRRAAGQ